MLQASDMVGWDAPEPRLVITDLFPSMQRMTPWAAPGFMYRFLGFPTDPNSYAAVAQLYERRRHEEHAQHWYEKAIFLGSAAATNDLAVMLARKGRTVEAEDLLKRVAEHEAIPNHNLALLALYRDDMTAAAESAIFAANCGNAEAMYLSHLLLEEIGDTEASRMWLTEAVAANFGAAINKLGLTTWDEDVDEAERYFRRAIRSGSAAAANNLAVLYDLQDKREALETYEAGVPDGLREAEAMELLRNTKRARPELWEADSDNGDLPDDNHPAIVLLLNFADFLIEHHARTRAIKILEPLVRTGSPEAAYRLARTQAGTTLSLEGESALHARWASRNGVHRASLLLAAYQLEQGDPSGALLTLQNPALEENGIAQRALGLSILREGRAEEGVALLNKAIDLGDPEARIALASLAEEQGDLRAAIDAITPACEQGYDRAQVMRATLLLNVEGQPNSSDNNVAQARDDLEEAAWSRNQEAEYLLAELLLYGEESVMAEFWARRAVEGGVTGGARIVGICMSRHGFLNSATQWLALAASQGIKAAVADLATVRRHVRTAKPTNYESFLRRICAMHERTGRRVEARRWLREAAAAGHGWALTGLAQHAFECGDPASSRLYLQEAARADDPPGMMLWSANLAAQGDAAGSRMWLQKAASHGHLKAMDTLAAALVDEGDEVRGELWFRRAWDEGSTEAALALGQLADSDGEHEHAMLWYMSGVYNGDLRCAERLEELLTLDERRWPHDLLEAASAAGHRQSRYRLANETASDAIRSYRAPGAAARALAELDLSTHPIQL